MTTVDQQAGSTPGPHAHLHTRRDVEIQPARPLVIAVTGRERRMPSGSGHATPNVQCPDQAPPAVRYRRTPFTCQSKVPPGAGTSTVNVLAASSLNTRAIVSTA